MLTRLVGMLLGLPYSKIAHSETQDHSSPTTGIGSPPRPIPADIFIANSSSAAHYTWYMLTKYMYRTRSHSNYKSYKYHESPPCVMNL